VNDLPEIRADVVEEMRRLADRGASVRQLVEAVRTRLGCDEEAVLPVLWYFTKAFHLPLKDVLPIREWFGTAHDEEIDATILPAIDHAKAIWAESIDRVTAAN